MQSNPINEKRDRPSRNKPLKNPTIYSKTALAVYKRRRFHMELMTGFEPVTSSLPTRAGSPPKAVFRHQLHQEQQRKFSCQGSPAAALARGCKCFFIAPSPAAPLLRTLPQAQAAPSASAAARFQGQRCAPSCQGRRASQRTVGSLRRER